MDTHECDAHFGPWELDDFSLEVTWLLETSFINDKTDISSEQEEWGLDEGGSNEKKPKHSLKVKGLNWLKSLEKKNFPWSSLRSLEEQF